MSVSESVGRATGFLSEMVGGQKVNGSVGPDATPPSGWSERGVALEALGGNRWLNAKDQVIVQIVCGHIRRWERPGVNLESLKPLQGDPFLLPDPNQLVSAQTWFWVVSVSGDGPRVAQSRYQNSKTDDGGVRVVELWEIRDLDYSTNNEYLFNATGVPTQITQAVHPSLPVAKLSQSEGSACRKRDS